MFVNKAVTAISGQSSSSLRRLTLLSGNLRAHYSSMYGKNPFYNVEDDIDERTITINSKKVESQYSLIWLHGLGDSAHGFASLFLEKETRFTPDNCRVVLLTAPERSVTLNDGMKMNSWYDIYSLRGDHIKSLDDLFSKYSREELMESVGIVSKRLDKEIASHNNDPKRVFIGGFSQGCALSLATFIHYEKTLGGVIGLSGMNAHKVDWEKVPQEKKDTSIFLYHGDDDDMISDKIAMRTYQELLDNKFSKVQITVEPGLGHHLSIKEIEALRSHFSKIMP